MRVGGCGGPGSRGPGMYYGTLLVRLFLHARSIEVQADIIAAVEIAIRLAIARSRVHSSQCTPRETVDQPASVCLHNWSQPSVFRVCASFPLVLMCPGAALMSNAQPTSRPPIKIVVPAEVSAAGVRLLPATDPGAANHITPDVLQYGVVLINEGPTRLLATAVGFKWIDEMGLPKMSIFCLSDFNVTHPSQVGKGQARLFLPQQGLNLQLAQPPVSRMDLTSEWSEVLAVISSNFAKARNLEAFVDSVTVEGIGLLGPDTARQREHGWNRKTL
jgi:hypothetical protein